MGGCEATSQHHQSPRTPITHTPPLPPTPLPNSSLPPLRGEVRWGVRSHEPAPPIAPHPDHPHPTTTPPTPSPIHPSPLSGVSCKMPNFGGSADQALSGRHLRACAGSAILQETPLRGEVRWGVQSHEPAPPIAPHPDRPRHASVATTATPAPGFAGEPAESAAKAPRRPARQTPPGRPPARSDRRPADRRCRNSADPPRNPPPAHPAAE